MKKSIHVSILGASGYTGAELIRLLSAHPHVQLHSLIAESNAGKPIAEIYPHLSHLKLPKLIALGEADFTNVDCVFACLPHGTSQEIIAGLPKHVKIIDLSADFRLFDEAAYQQWYGHKHQAPKLQKEAVYGLTEIYRDKIKKARLIANPGCYPSSVLLPLIPLMKEKAISSDVIADSKSGISGAGRSAKVPNLFAEANEDVRPYGIGGHRHVAEMEQELGLALGKKVEVTFTPHVVPLSRGMVSVLYVESKLPAAKLKVILQKAYKNEPFIHIPDGDLVPTSRQVMGSNMTYINLFDDRKKGRVIIISALDNLVKGASGQAVQNFNVVFGYEEPLALPNVAIFP